MSFETASNLSRRAFIERGAMAGAAITIAAPHAWAADTASLPRITKKIPKTGEELPVIGLGTNAYGVRAPDELVARREVLQQFPVLGAKVIDTARAYGDSELVLGRYLKELGIRDRIFLATKTPIVGAIAPGEGELEAAFQRLQTNKIDLMQIHSFHQIDALFPRLLEWKQAGKVRYVGVTTSTDTQYSQMKDALNTLPLDFIQIDYSIDNRGAGEEILPLAQEKGVAVLINVPLGGRRGNVLSKLSGKPLPPWAADIDATSWAQVMLKYSVAHPAVTAVIPGTTKLAHLEDNQRAGRGRLPDAALRKKMEEFWATV